jgi:hypothetical protein
LNQGSFQKWSWWHHPFESEGSTIASSIVSQWYICKILFYFIYICVCVCVCVYSFCYLCWKSGIFPATILMAPSLRIWRVYNRFVYCKSMVYLQDIFLLYIFIYSFCYLCWKSGIFPGINWLGQYQTAYDIVKTWQCCKCFFLEIKTVLHLYMDGLILNQIPGHLPVTALPAATSSMVL